MIFVSVFLDDVTTAVTFKIKDKFSHARAYSHYFNVVPDSVDDLASPLCTILGVCRVLKCISLSMPLGPLRFLFFLGLSLLFPLNSPLITKSSNFRLVMHDMSKKF